MKNLLYAAVCVCVIYMIVCKCALLFTIADSNGCTSFEILRQFENSLQSILAIAALALSAPPIVCMAVHMRHLFYYLGYVHILLLFFADGLRSFWLKCFTAHSATELCVILNTS